ncbi:hypothetical protein HDU83_002305 [Entophlyctis luteolus]|nr:hypothetical protein HDU83_002305 [Entophlyctis luteolus]
MASRKSTVKTTRFSVAENPAEESQGHPAQHSNTHAHSHSHSHSHSHEHRRSSLTMSNESIHPHAPAAASAKPFSPTSSVAILRVTKSTARTATLTWTLRDDIPARSTPVQIVKAEGRTDPQFTRVFEGIVAPESDAPAAAAILVVENLKPETEYRFKLRVWDPVRDEFSADFAEAVAVTTDESRLIKVQLKLYRAVAENNVQAFHDLMEENRSEINIEMRDKNGKTMLMGTREMVQEILSYGALQTTTTQSKKTPLSIAVSYSNIEAVRAFLQDTHAINMPDLGGSTPLMWSVEHANFKNGIEIVALLLEAGADVSREDANGLTAMDRLCATSGNAKCARLLLEFGATIVNKVDPPKRKLTTLMMAALNGHKDLCYELIDNWGADVLAKTEYGQTARVIALSPTATAFPLSLHSDFAFNSITLLIRM